MKEKYAWMNGIDVWCDVKCNEYEKLSEDDLFRIFLGDPQQSVTFMYDL